MYWITDEEGFAMKTSLAILLFRGSKWQIANPFFRYPSLTFENRIQTI